MTRHATADELHVFLVGEIARRNRAAADLQRPIIPGREDRAVDLLLASVSACGLSIVREDLPIQGSGPIGWKE